jgi:hypothetical protein
MVKVGKIPSIVLTKSSTDTSGMSEISPAGPNNTAMNYQVQNQTLNYTLL